MKYGLSNEQLETMRRLLSEDPAIDEAVLFGSRAIGTFKEASDIDLAIKGDSFDIFMANSLKSRLEEETNIPFFFDIVAYKSIKSEEVRRHIGEEGVVIYFKGMGAWREYKIGDVIISNVQSVNKDYHHKIIQYLDTGSVTCGKIDSFQELLLENAPSRAKRLVEHNDIVYSTIRPIQRHYALIRNPLPNLVVSTGFSVIKTKMNLAEPLFIYYYLTSAEIVEILDVIADGATSAYPSLKPSDIENLEISLPSLPEQKAIVAVLSSLDDKIDLLHRQNKTLEAMAETLFRQWFVEEARDDWEDGHLLELIELIGGGTPKTSIPEYWDGDISWLAGGDIAANHKSFVKYAQKCITEIGLDNSSAKLLPKYATVISARGTVGKYCMLAQPMTFSQSNYGILPKNSRCYFFAYLLINHVVEELQSSAYGSVFDTITTTTFRENKVVLPPENEIFKFEDNISPYFQKMFSNKSQIQILEKLRNTLLPKLTSGEVRVEYKI